MVLRLPLMPPVVTSPPVPMRSPEELSLPVPLTPLNESVAPRSELLLPLRFMPDNAPAEERPRPESSWLSVVRLELSLAVDEAVLPSCVFDCALRLSLAWVVVRPPVR